MNPWRRGAQILGLAQAPASGLLVMLVVIDFALIAAHLSLKYLGFPDSVLVDLGVDRGWGEFFQYAKSTWVGLLLLFLFTRRRAGVFLVWAAACAYLVLDDALQLHERAGWAARDLTPGHPVWAIHIGELVFLGLVGAVLVVALVITHLRAAPADRAVSAVLMVLFGVLVVIGVGIDAVHHLLFPADVFDVPFTTLEDGGEMLALSLVVAFVFAVALCEHAPSMTGRMRRLVDHAQR